MRTPLALLLISFGAIAAVWWWLATPITLARAPIDPKAKLLCVSYAPFRGAQTPLDLTTHIPPEQIAQDLVQLAKISDCVRTYSIENGLDQVPALAAKAGLKVMQGIWLGSDRLKNAIQISTAVRLSKEYPGVITSFVVGNEVLLRGEMTTTDLANLIRQVKSAGRRSRHLCRRLGILVALPRDLRGRRLRHHPYPALLGGLPDPREIRGHPCQPDPAARWP